MAENRIAGRQMAAPVQAGKISLTASMNALLDSEGYRKRFDELLGKRTPQFVGSIISMINATPQLQEAFRANPVSVVQSALKAAAFDLPIDPALGYAYIVPFRGRDGMAAQFILGYKGMVQMALRTGAYKVINVVDVREGELRHYNRLTEEIDLAFVEDEEERESLPVIGWAAYYKLINGTEKTIFMSKKQIDAHERKNRKGSYQSQGWRDNYDAMAAKTVLRRLLSKWGLMSIDYQHQSSPAAMAAAEAISNGFRDDDDTTMDDEPIVRLPFDEDTDGDTEEQDELPFDPVTRG